MANKKFTPDEMEQLRSNPYTYKVSSCQIFFTAEFKEKFYQLRQEGFTLKEDAFDELFLDVSFLSDELLTFFDLYKSNQRFSDGEHCVLTIFNGEDKGKTFKVHKEETILIGRKANFNANDLASFTILLDNSYSTVSNVGKPHLKLFHKDDGWYILDECSSNGTYIADRKVPTGIETKLKANSFLKLSKGNGGAVIYCSF
jgi:hypothetical protein